eukprot:355782-Chlamydomonas_euryale.AAC.9
MRAAGHCCCLGRHGGSVGRRRVQHRLQGKCKAAWFVGSSERGREGGAGREEGVEGLPGPARRVCTALIWGSALATTTHQAPKPEHRSKLNRFILWRHQRAHDFWGFAHTCSDAHQKPAKRLYALSACPACTLSPGENTRTCSPPGSRTPPHVHPPTPAYHPPPLQVTLAADDDKYAVVRTNGQKVLETSDVGTYARPAQFLELYEYEACPFCKKVRWEGWVWRRSVLSVRRLNKVGECGRDGCGGGVF